MANVDTILHGSALSIMRLLADRQLWTAVDLGWNATPRTERAPQFLASLKRHGLTRCIGRKWWTITAKGVVALARMHNATP